VTTAQMNAVLMYVTNVTRDTAPVTLQIGYVDAGNIVRHDGIRITDAPETVTAGVIDYVRNMRGTQDKGGYVGVSLHNGALHIA